MLDGHVNKCKECNKNDVRGNYEKNAKDPLYIEKERERSKEKYHRLGYKEKQKEWDEKRPWNKNCKKTNLRRKLKLRNKLKTHQLHHWNYNDEYIEDIIIIERFNHRRAHKYLTLDLIKRYFIGLDGEILDTKQKHIDYLIKKGIEIQIN
jgi:hypothetical protein